MFIGYLKGVQKVAGWCLSLEGVSGQVELYLRMEFDSGVGPTCLDQKMVKNLIPFFSTPSLPFSLCRIKNSSDYCRH